MLIPDKFQLGAHTIIVAKSVPLRKLEANGIKKLKKYGYALNSSRYLPHYQASQGIFPQTARAYASIF